MMGSVADDTPLRPQPIEFAFENIPAELKAIPQWVLWRYLFRDKWTKPPFNAHTGEFASSTDSATWVDYEMAVAAYRKGGFDGIGFVLTREQRIVGIDLDHCIDNSNAIAPWALAIIKGFDAYTEVSPSRTGIHIYFRADKSGGGRKRGNIEVYPDGRYLTFTGRVLKAYQVRTIEPRQAELDAFVAEHFPEPKIEKSAAANGNGHTHRSDHEILELALRAKNGDKVRSLLNGDCGGYPSQSEADVALCSLLAFYTRDENQIDRIYRGSRLFRDKWDDKHYGDGTTYGARTIDKAISSTTETYSGDTHTSRVQGTPFVNENAALGVGVPPERDVPEQVQKTDIDPPAEVLFPTVAWTGLFGAWRDMTASKTEAPLPYLWAAFLQSVGLMVGRSAWHESPWPTYPNSYILLLGETGESRKSTVQRFERELLNQLGVSIDLLYGIVSAEGIIERLSQQDEIRALGYVDEFRSLLSVGKRKGTMDILPKLQTLYDCPDEMATDRRKDPATAIRPFFSLLAATPQDFVADLLGELEVVGGFLNRFMIVTGEEQPPKPIVSAPTAAEWARITEPLNRIREQVDSDPHCWVFEPEAAELWNEFYISWKKTRSKWNSKARNLTSRTTDHVRKIALIYSVLASRRSIDAKSLATAIQIGEWLESNALRVFGDIGLDHFGRAEGIVAEILSKSKSGFMYRRDLQRIVGKKGVNGEMFGRVLRAMESNEHITTGFHTTVAGQRRPTVQQIRE